MRVESIALPHLGTPSAVFSLWYVSIGERVQVGDRLAEVLIPGALVEVAASSGGTIHAQNARAGDTLAANQALGTLFVEADS